jgi:hypothetical protein
MRSIAAVPEGWWSRRILLRQALAREITDHDNARCYAEVRLERDAGSGTAHAIHDGETSAHCWLGIVRGTVGGHLIAEVLRDHAMHAD